MRDEHITLPSGFTYPHTLAGLSADASVLAAFSGGADSSALLHMLADYSRLTGAKIYAAHVNHCIRGAEADRDEAFCRSVADGLGIELFVLRCDVPAYAKEHGLSIETAARDVRYGFFADLMREHSIPMLATAHNANDNLETMLFNMTRGCGLKGLCGIPVTRSCEGGTVVRPILSMSRREILDYCSQRSITFVTDSTNVDTDYTRNKIRAQIIPALMEINEGAVENASRLSRSLNSDRLCLESMTDWFLEELSDDASLETEKLLGAPRAVGDRAIIALYESLSCGRRLEHVHIEAVRELCEKCVPHSRIQLPCGIDARIEDGRLYVDKREPSPTSPEEFRIPLCEGENQIPQINAKIIIRNSQSEKNFNKNSILLYLDSAKICGSLTARQRIAGDKIKINGMSKSVKKLLCDKKAPLEIRQRLPVICDGEGIVAIPYIGVCDRVRAKNGDLVIEIRLF